MAKLTKKQKKLAETVDRNKLYGVDEAISAIGHQKLPFDGRSSRHGSITSAPLQVTGNWSDSGRNRRAKPLRAGPNLRFAAVCANGPRFQRKLWKFAGGRFGVCSTAKLETEGSLRGPAASPTA